MTIAKEQTSQPGAWWAVFGALSATLVGIGLSRFAYTPLIPALIEAGWFAPADVVYLGAANLAGYLAGALIARPLASRWPATLLIRAMMVLATVAFFASATPLSFLWYFIWRVASGIAGGVLMALAAPIVLPLVSTRRQGLAGGLVFTGVGLGIAASGTLVPLLLDLGLVETWCGLGLVALVLTIATWRVWPADDPRQRTGTSGAQNRTPTAPALTSLYVEYALVATGLVPHMVFLVDFIARGLAQGVAAGSGYWVLFGIGAMAGPVLAGRFADWTGFKVALRLSYLLQAAGVGWLYVSDSMLALAVSSVLIGAFVPGVVTLVLGRARELLPGDPARQQAAWSLATTAFAVGQAAAAYGFSFLFEETASHLPLFALGGIAFVLALALNLLVGLVSRRK